MWLGSQVNREEIAKRVSPLTYVRAGVPPILMIHGDADKTVALFPVSPPARVARPVRDSQ